jgi:integrative and conjugative element protein (TIGR02256 family)
LNARTFSAGAVRLKIDRIVLEGLLSFIQNRPWKREAGGVLLGRRISSTRDAVADEITKPMRRDRRTRYSFKRQDPGHQKRIDAIWKHSGHTGGYLGEWHTHPEPRPTPSNIDREDWIRRLRADDVDGDDVFFVIVGTKELAAWHGIRSSQTISPMHLNITLTGSRQEPLRRRKQ